MDAFTIIIIILTGIIVIALWAWVRLMSRVNRPGLFEYPDIEGVNHRTDRGRDEHANK